MTQCKDCPAPAKDGARCRPHRQRHNAREQARRDERRRKRLCWVCGDKARPGQRACEPHQNYRAERAAITAEETSHAMGK